MKPLLKIIFVLAILFAGFTKASSVIGGKPVYSFGKSVYLTKLISPMSDSYPVSDSFIEDLDDTDIEDDSVDNANNYTYQSFNNYSISFYYLSVGIHKAFLHNIYLSFLKVFRI
jgi:hypothetical protein